MEKHKTWRTDFEKESGFKKESFFTKTFNIIKGKRQISVSVAILVIIMASGLVYDGRTEEGTIEAMTPVNSDSENTTKIITEKIYIKNAEDVSFNYDSKTVKVQNGKLVCVDDDRILQWHKGIEKWECRKPTHVVFGDLDSKSVEINGSGELECENHDEILFWDGEDDQWACESKTAALSGGDGIDEDDGEISIDSPTCSASEKLTWDGDSFECATDLDTQTLSFNSGTGELSISSGNTVDLTGLAGTLDHNSLSGLQGGTTNEYYHLTSAQESNLTGFSDAVSLPSADGSNGQTLQTNGSGAVSWSTPTFLALSDTMGSYTAGSMLFTSGSAVTEDNANLFYDDTANSLGIGTNTVSARAHIKGTTSDNTAYGLKVDDSSDAKNFYVQNDGQVEFKNFTFPIADGTSNQVLKTNGSGVLSWADDTAGTGFIATGLYKDWNFPVSTLNSGGGAFPAVIDLASTNVEVSAFDGGVTTEEVSGVIEIDHDYEEGTDLIPHIHWLPTDAGAGDVVWQLEYTILDDGDIAGSSTTITVQTSTNSTAWENVRSSFPTIDGTGLTINDQIFFRLFRDPTDGNDTYGSDAAAATIGFHYQANSLGSTGVVTK